MGLALEKTMLQDLPTDELVRVEKPIFTHSALRVGAGDVTRGKAPRYVYRSGLAQLGKYLAQGIDVRLQQPIETIERSGEGFAMAGEEFDALILTPPIPQSTALLWQLDERRPTANVTYRCCLSILLGYAKPLETPYHAIIDVEQRHPLGWLSVETAKCPGRAPEGHTALVLQLSSAYSLEHYMAEDDFLCATAISFVTRLYGADWHEPEVRDVKRWKYSQPEGFSAMESVNRPGSRLVLAGDGLSGPRVERAYESGYEAARLLDES